MRRNQLALSMAALLALSTSCAELSNPRPATGGQKNGVPMVRVQGPGPFSILIPAGLARTPARAIDTRAHAYEGAGRRLIIAYGGTGGIPDSVGKSDFRAVVFKVQGRPAHVASYGYASPISSPYGYGFEAYVPPAKGSSDAINIALACSSKAACEVGTEILQSIQFH
jgi:hypothetical protein